MSDLKHILCCSCRLEFGVPASFERAAREDSRVWFYCPNGHQQHFTDNDFDKLRRERDRLKQKVAEVQDEAKTAWNTANQQAEQRAAAERRVSAARGQITRLKKRAAAGVCPCCNRTFVDLQRHMAVKHRDFVAEEIDLEGATLQ